MGDRELEQQGERLAAAISRILRSLNKLESEEIETALTIPQARVCGLLREGPQAMTAVSRELGISLSAVTQIADRLQREGLVSRTCGEDDRRVRLLQLTEQGLQRVQRRHARRLQRALIILETMPADQREVSLKALEALAAAVPAVTPAEDEGSVR
jgi:DNA-binding MarR family transcriptional regulator